MAEGNVEQANEIWKPIPDREGYEASSHGRVRSVDRVVQTSTGARRYKGQLLRPYRQPRGYVMALLGVKNCHYVHRLVLEAFVGPCPEGMEACHNNGDRGDNRVSNLRWGTAVDNAADRDRHGTQARGESVGNSTLTENDIRRIRALREAGKTQQSIADEIGTDQRHVSRILRRAAWRHVA